MSPLGNRFYSEAASVPGIGLKGAQSASSAVGRCAQTVPSSQATKIVLGNGTGLSVLGGVATAIPTTFRMAGPLLWVKWCGYRQDGCSTSEPLRFVSQQTPDQPTGLGGVFAGAVSHRGCATSTNPEHDGCAQPDEVGWRASAGRQKRSLLRWPRTLFKLLDPQP